MHLCFIVADIEPATATLYTMASSHKMSCVLQHIREKAVGVSWTTDTKTSNIYSPEDGTHAANTFKQTSTLTLSSSQLTALKAVSDTVTFTCQVNHLSAKQVINLHTPGNLSMFSHQNL